MNSRTLNFTDGVRNFEIHIEEGEVAETLENYPKDNIWSITSFFLLPPQVQMKVMEHLRNAKTT